MYVTFVFQIAMAYINSPLFLEKGKALSSYDINRLISKRTVSRRDAMQDSGNTTPMCTAVIECDPGSGHVSGSRWFVSGMLPTEIKIKDIRWMKIFEPEVKKMVRLGIKIKQTQN